MNNINGRKFLDAYQIICKILAFYKINSKQFCTKIGVNLTYVNDAKNKKTKKITNDVADKILSHYPELNRIWLITGEGEMFSNGNITNTAIGNNNAGDIIQGQTVEVSKTRDELLQSQQRTIELLTNQANKFQEQIDRFLSMLEKCLEQDNKLHDK